VRKMKAMTPKLDFVHSEICSRADLRMDKVELRNFACALKKGEA
jgi:hypothetical protein